MCSCPWTTVSVPGGKTCSIEKMLELQLWQLVQLQATVFNDSPVVSISTFLQRQLPLDMFVMAMT